MYNEAVHSQDEFSAFCTLKNRLKMMEALTQDTRFTDMAEEMLEKQREGKEIAMCE